MARWQRGYFRFALLPPCPIALSPLAPLALLNGLLRKLPEQSYLQSR